MMSETRDVDLEEGLAILGLLGAMRTEERTEHGEGGQTLVQINVAQFAAVADVPAKGSSPPEALGRFLGEQNAELLGPTKREGLGERL